MPRRLTGTKPATQDETDDDTNFDHFLAQLMEFADRTFWLGECRKHCDGGQRALLAAQELVEALVAADILTAYCPACGNGFEPTGELN